MSVQYRRYQCRDIGEPQLTIQKCGYGNLIGGIQHGGCAATDGGCLLRQTQTGKPL